MGMNDICVYNSDRIQRLWCNCLSLKRQGERTFFYFEIEAEVSAFSAKVYDFIEKDELETLQKEIALLYKQEKSEIAFNSFQKAVRVELKYELGGRVSQRFYIREYKTFNYLEINDSFDQTFLPELEERISDILINANQYDDYVSGAYGNLEKCPLIHFSNFRKYLDSDSFSFEFKYIGNAFKVLMNSGAYVEELLQFERRLERLLGDEISVCTFAPLGEFFLLEIVRENGFSVKGSFSDTLFPQSHLSFQENVNMEIIEDMMNEIKQCCM